MIFNCTIPKIITGKVCGCRTTTKTPYGASRTRAVWLLHNPTHFEGFSTLLSAPNILTERSNILSPGRSSDDSISSAVRKDIIKLLLESKPSTPLHPL